MLFNPRDIVPETLADDDEELPTDPSADRLAMVRSAACRGWVAEASFAQQPCFMPLLSCELGVCLLVMCGYRACQIMTSC